VELERFDEPKDDKETSRHYDEQPIDGKLALEIVLVVGDALHESEVLVVILDDADADQEIEEATVGQDLPHVPEIHEGCEQQDGNEIRQSKRTNQIAGS
jgi:hypothetical protein